MSSAAEPKAQEVLSGNKISVYNVILAPNPENPGDPLCLVADKPLIAGWMHGGVLLGVPIVNNPGQPVFPGGSVDVKDMQGRTIGYRTGQPAGEQELREELGLVYRKDDQTLRLKGALVGRVTAVTVASHADDQCQTCQWELASKEDLERVESSVNAAILADRRRVGLSMAPTVIVDDEARQVRCMPLSKALELFQLPLDKWPDPRTDDEYNAAYVKSGVKKKPSLVLNWYEAIVYDTNTRLLTKAESDDKKRDHKQPKI